MADTRSAAELLAASDAASRQASIANYHGHADQARQLMAAAGDLQRRAQKLRVLEQLGNDWPQ